MSRSHSDDLKARNMSSRIKGTEQPIDPDIDPDTQSPGVDGDDGDDGDDE